MHVLSVQSVTLPTHVVHVAGECSALWNITCKCMNTVNSLLMDTPNSGFLLNNGRAFMARQNSL